MTCGRHPGVGLGSADHEFTGLVDENFSVAVDHVPDDRLEITSMISDGLYR